VTAVANTMTVQAAPGTVAVPLQSGAGCALCRWDANETPTIATAPPTGNSRIDLVIVQVRDNALDAGANNDFIVTTVTGTPAASNPAVPAVPTNALALAQVLVPGAAANLNGATITDRRTPLGMGLGYVASAVGPPADSQAGAGFASMLTLTVFASAARHYRIDAFFSGYQATGTGDIQAQLTTPAGAILFIYAQGKTSTNNWTMGSLAGLVWTPAVTGLASIGISAGSFNATGLLTCPANSLRLLVTDIGPV
jgi:hypothetical protein